jgi:hypothetical protein
LSIKASEVGSAQYKALYRTLGYNRSLEDYMENWKRALLAGSAGASAIMLLKGNRTVGLLLAGVSLATLASEYPNEFAEFRDNLPHYVERTSTFLDVVSRVGERLTTRGGARGTEWLEALLNR